MHLIILFLLQTPMGCVDDNRDEDEEPGGRGQSPDDGWKSKGYDYFFERDRNFGSERDDFMADMGQEFSLEANESGSQMEENCCPDNGPGPKLKPACLRLF